MSFIRMLIPPDMLGPTQGADTGSGGAPGAGGGPVFHCLAVS